MQDPKREGGIERSGKLKIERVIGLEQMRAQRADHCKMMTNDKRLKRALAHFSRPGSSAKVSRDHRRSPRTPMVCTMSTKKKKAAHTSTREGKQARSGEFGVCVRELHAEFKCK